MTAEIESRNVRDIAPEAVQLFLAGVVIASERLLQQSDLTQFLVAIALEAEAATTQEGLLEPNVREDLFRILEEFQKARHLVRVQLRDPPTDLMT